MGVAFAHGSCLNCPYSVGNGDAKKRKLRSLLRGLEVAATTDEQVAHGDAAQTGGQAASEAAGPAAEQNAGQSADQEWLRNYIAEQHGAGGAKGAIETPKKKSPFLKIALLGALVTAGAATYLAKNTDLIGPSQPKEGPTDLGQGISSATGLRGHLIAVWDGKAEYRLKVEPIDPRDDDAFLRVTEKTPQPLFINVRMLNKAGEVLCGKQVELTANTGNGAALASGADAFKRLPLKKNGDIDGLWAQGSLPCSGEQYKQFDYWDFSTNFPTVAQQEDLPEPKVETQPQNITAEPARDAHEASATPTIVRKRISRRPQAAYLMEGDDQALEFEPARGVLTLASEKSFVLSRNAADLAVAAAWADNSSMVHYTCDSRLNCSLRRGSSTIAARMN